MVCYACSSLSLRAIEFDRESTGDIRTNYPRPNESWSNGEAAGPSGCCRST